MQVEEPRLKASDVLVRYGDITALDSFSADIPAGIVGLLGPNGAGKSTFIKVVLGLVEPERGDIYMDGVNIRENMMFLRDRVGYLPEDECLIENINAFKLVSYMGELSGMKKNDAVRRAHEVLDFTGIGEERYREISSYSTGMRQRVKLAQTIVHDPKIMFLDEPTNGMDPEGREEMLSLIKKIGEHEKTVLVCSHILNEVQQVADHVLILNNGRLMRSGKMKDILKGEEGKYKIIVRGEAEEINGYIRSLSRSFEIRSTREEGGQRFIVISGVESSKKVFELTTDFDIQLRAFKPDVLTLEDVFIGSFRGGDKDGD